MSKTRKRKVVKDEQPYKVPKVFKNWMDSQINIMRSNLRTGRFTTNKFEKLELEIQLQSYEFIRGILK